MTPRMKPPTLAERILRWCLPPGNKGRSIVGDLAADYAQLAVRSSLRASLWYWRQVVAIGLPYVFLSIRRARRHETSWAESGAPSRVANGIKDIRYAVRALRRSPGFTGISIATLALAIGATSAIFTIVDAVLLNPLPFENTDRLVSLTGSAPGSDLPDEFYLPSEFYVQYRDDAELLEDIASYTSFTNTVRTNDRVERVRVGASTASLFSTIGTTPIIGRLPTEEDDGLVAVLSHSMWTNWFGSDPDVLGRAYHIAGTERTIIGVMGPDFWFNSDQVLVWIPYVVRPERITPGRGFGSGVVARLAPGATHEALAEQLQRVAQRIPARFGGSATYAQNIARHRPIVRSLYDDLLGDVAPVLWVLLASGGVVVLIACANVANLFLVRFEGRQRELAVRQAIGATRAQLFSAQMAETVVVAAGAGVLAVALASIGGRLILNAAPTSLPRLDDVGLSVSSFLFTFGLCLLVALLCGLVPALRASKPSVARLRDGGRGSTRRGHAGRDATVVGQTALALVLLIGSGLLVRSFWKLSHVDPGYTTQDIFTFQIAPEGDYSDGPAYAQLHLEFMDRVAALPGVEMAGLVENVPLDESVRTVRFRTQARADQGNLGPLLGLTFAAGDYFRVMDIEVLRGRTFIRPDHSTDLGNVVVSQAAADLLWPDQDPIGRQLWSDNPEAQSTVIGVVEDIVQDDFRDDPDPLVYYPLVGPTPNSWVMSSPGYVVRTTRADVIAPEIRALVREYAPGAPMYRTYTMEGLAADSMVYLSFSLLTLGIASGLALILGAVGLYGILSYVVAERTQEIGLRMALGAQAMRVQLMVVGQGARVAALGVLVGAVAAVGATRVLRSLLYGVDALDLGTFLGMSAAMILVGLLASYLPALRASRMDPIDSLRSE
jgi:predicted permease